MNSFRLPWAGEMVGTPALAGVSHTTAPPGRRSLLRRHRPERLPISALKQRDVQKRVGIIFLGKVLGLMAAAGFLLLFYFLFETAAGASPAEAGPK
ncbi:MAG: hypothetical protein U0P45_15705, partial [Acidimicrobiales bacterium]